MRKHTQLSDITEAEVSRLKKLARSDLSPLGLVKRCSALLALIDGESASCAAATLNVKKSEIEQWRDRFFSAGFRGWYIDLHPTYAARRETWLKKEAEVINCVCDDPPPESHDYWSLEEVAKALNIGKDFVSYVFDRYDISFSDTVPESERGKPVSVAGARHSLFEKLNSHRAGPKENWSSEKEQKFFAALTDGQSVATAAALAGLTQHQLNTRLEQDIDFEIRLRQVQAGTIKRVEEALKTRALGYKYTEREEVESDSGFKQVVRHKEFPPDVKACELWLTNIQPSNWSKQPRTESESKGVLLNIGGPEGVQTELPGLGCESPTDEELVASETELFRELEARKAGS